MRAVVARPCPSRGFSHHVIPVAPAEMGGAVSLKPSNNQATNGAPGLTRSDRTLRTGLPSVRVRSIRYERSRPVSHPRSSVASVRTDGTLTTASPSPGLELSRQDVDVPAVTVIYLALPRGAQWRPVSCVEISIGDPLGSSWYVLF